jgi:FkbM family methyltransferase
VIKPARTTASDKAVALLRQGIALHNQHRLDEADAIYKKVLLQAPLHADALHLRALVCHARQRFADAARFAESAVAVAPRVANFHNTAGEAWRRQGRLDLAQKYLRQAVALDPSMPMAHLNLSLALSSGGRHQEARACAARALELNPDYVEALAQALSISCALDDHAGAPALLERLERCEGEPIAAEALGRYHNHLARIHFRHERPGDAATEADTALALFPHFWGNWTLRAELCNDALEFSEAERYCTIAANLAPDIEDARLNLGHLLLEQKCLDQAESHYAGWLATHPDSAAARFGLASINLLRGDFEAGWTHYEARWELRQHGGGARNAAAPAWDGGPCARLLLYAEQGLGDTIQMLRFLPQVVRRCGGAVTLQVPAPLVRIARRALGAQGVDVLAEVPPGALFDSVCPLMSLPHVLQAYTKEELGMRAPYLTADSGRRAFFDTMLAHLPGEKIGIVWQGGAAGLTNRRRPFPLDALAPLLAIPGISLVSLQFGIRKPAVASQAITDLADHIHDFDDLAAAMMALDAVISVDTGPAHLAGALGIAAYTLIPWLHDWRWGLDGASTYWYPAMTLVRQTGAGEWDSAVKKLAAMVDPTHDRSSAACQGGAVAAIPGLPGARDTRDRIIGRNLFPFVQVNCGEETIVAPLFDPAATRCLLVYGEYLQHECELLASCLHSGDTVIDVGAGLGISTINLARAVGRDGRVIAFEPNKTRNRCLTEGVVINCLPWVDVRRQAVGRRNGKVKVANLDPAREFENGGQARADLEAIELVALDSLRLTNCALIQINCHGQELEVLEGARALIDQARPVLHLACPPQDAMTAAVQFLKDRGYQVFRRETAIFRPGNHRNCQVNLFADRTAVSLLALPQNEMKPPTGAVKV